MRFRALMQDAQYMREFHSIIMTLSKLAKECIMIITPTQLHFIANEESGTTAPLVWVDIDAKLYFNEYTMDAHIRSMPATTEEEAATQIMLAVGTANLGRALAALRQNARHCKIKLNKIQFPCLTIETDTVPHATNVEQSRVIVHDVPVNVIARCDWPAYRVPRQPQCKLVLTMPSNRLMRSLIDKIKNISPTIIFYATANGEMNLVAETEMATITTRYKHLEVRKGPEAAKKTCKPADVSCSVDCKKTAIFFAALQVPTLELSCGIADEHLIHLEVNVRQGVAIHSILPAVCA